MLSCHLSGLYFKKLRIVGMFCFSAVKQLKEENTSRPPLAKGSTALSCSCRRLIPAKTFDCLCCKRLCEEQVAK